MRLLVDTHAFLWWAVGSNRMSEKAAAALADPDNEVLVSAASAWELATKHRLGRLAEGGAIVARFADTVRELRASELAISSLHALAAGAFPAEHRDPFDRMLAAQAALEGAVLVTIDPMFRFFPVTVLW